MLDNTRDYAKADLGEASAYSATRRNLLDIANSLHGTGVSMDIEIPRIIVIGSQSTGKSSLLESVCKISLPRASGTCTRCPTECRLSRSSEPWRCIVSLRLLTDRHGNADPRNIPFGNPITDPAEVAERIKRAQRAILNPSTQSSFFLGGGEDTAPETTFSRNCVSLEISGPDVVDISFVDLPGLIASAGSSSTLADIDLVKCLITEYAEREDCIMLVTVSCETEFENQGAYQLARSFDRAGERTIGVLTKPDRVARGDEDWWVGLLKNEHPSLSLANGWFSVKQPDNVELKKGITHKQAAQQEKQFFATTKPWDTLPPRFKQCLGTSNLMEQCSNILSRLIAKRLPEIQMTIQEKLRTAETQIDELPLEPTDPVGEVFRLVSELCSTLTQYVEGTPSPDGLQQTIRPEKEKFLRTIRETAPDFRPYEKSDGVSFFSTLTPPQFLENEEEPSLPEDDNNAIYIDQVKEAALSAVTRELPDNIPFIATELFIRAAVARWKAPAMQLFDHIEGILRDRITEAVHAQCEMYPQLDFQISTVVDDYMNRRSERTKERIRWLLDLEERPRILNDYHYRDYRSKFLTWYKSHRSQFHNIPLLQKLQGHERNPSDLSGKIKAIVDAFGALDGGPLDIMPVNLVKVLRTDPYEIALDIMASVRAYFQIAYKRFADNVPNVIDHELVLGLNRGHALETVLRIELGLSGPDVENVCAAYLREDGETAAHRSELKSRLGRLKKAKSELARLRK